MDRLEGLVIERLREINAVEDGAGMRRELLRVYFLWCHLLASLGWRRFYAARLQSSTIELPGRPAPAATAGS